MLDAAGKPATSHRLGLRHAPATCPTDKPIELTKEIGLRIWVRQKRDHATVASNFTMPAPTAPAAFVSSATVWLATGCARREAIRNRSSARWTPRFFALAKIALSLSAGAVGARRTLALREFWKILRGQPAPLVPHGTTAHGGKVADIPGFLWQSFDRTRHERLRGAARAQGVTLNDLLLRDLFLTLDRWQGKRLSWFHPRRLRIIMPTELRGAEDYLMPAANMTAYTFLACAAGEVRRPKELLRTIRDKTAQIKHERSGTRFMDMIYGATRVRGLLPFLLRRKLCMASAILSNLADPSRRFTARLPRQAGRIVAGNLVLEELMGVPPLRPGTRATFSISQYDSRLTISLRCDPHLFCMEDTRSLLRLYVEQLNRSAGLPH